MDTTTTLTPAQPAITFGYRPVGNMPRIYWGARAIFVSRYANITTQRVVTTKQGKRRKSFTKMEHIVEVDVVWDRQSTIGEPEEVKLLVKWVNSKGLKAIRKLAKELSTSEHRTVSFEDGEYVIMANPQCSYGYLYIGAWSRRAI